MNVDFKFMNKGSIYSLNKLLSKTNHYKYNIFYTDKGDVQVNYYSKYKEPLEIFVSYHKYEVLFPDDTEDCFTIVKDIIKIIDNYYNRG